PGSEQRLQVEPDGVLVHAQGVSDLGAGQWAVGVGENPQHLLAAGGDRHCSLIRFRGCHAHPAAASPCGGTEATSGVSTPRCPIFAAPPGEPSGSLRPGSTVEKNASLSAR